MILDNGELKFPECRECRYHFKTRSAVQCGFCGSGEFFEEKGMKELDAAEMYRVRRKKKDDNDDE